MLGLSFALQLRGVAMDGQSSHRLYTFRKKAVLPSGAQGVKCGSSIPFSD